MDNNVQEGVIAVDSVGRDPRKRDIASTSNPVQDNEEREEKRFRKSENEISEYNDNPSRTCLRETSSASRPSSQFLNNEQYNGRPMMSNYSDVSNERWPKYNGRGNSNCQSRSWCKDGNVPYTGWSNEHSRHGIYGNDRFNRQGTHENFRAENATWPNEHHRNGRYASNTTSSNDWHNRQQIYGTHKPEDPTRHERYGNHRAEDRSWRNEWNQQGRYESYRDEDTTRSDGHQRQENYGGGRLHMPGLPYENYRHGGNFNDRYENTSSLNSSYRRGGHWNPQYSTRGRAPSYSTRGGAPSYSTRGEAPSYSTRGGAPSYSTRGGTPSYSTRGGTPNYSNREGTPCYSTRGRAPSYLTRGRGPSYSTRGRGPSYSTRGRGPSYSARGRAPSYHERCMAMPSLKNAENVESAAMVSLFSTEKSTVDLLPAGESELSCRLPICSESVNSDLNKFDEASSKQNDGGCCNIEDKSLKSERSSELEISDCKTKIVKDDERLENEQRHALENCFSQSETVNNSSVQILCKPLDVLPPFPERPLATTSRKKLLILDINGLLADIIFPAPKDCKQDSYFYGRAIFKRPFCYNFLEFCFENFHVGIWSSRARKIIDGVVNYLFGNRRSKLVLCWDISQCTPTNFKTIENKHKGLVFKELKKIWENDDPQLPWKKGEYNASNTLLLDDSPYKSLLNPLHSAIFPKSYSFKDTDDYSLGPEGDLRVYLENLAAAEDVQKYVEQNPFGQKRIDEADSNWSFYSEAVSSCSNINVASMENECEPSCMPSATNESNNITNNCGHETEKEG